jgi:MFS family permease
MLAWAITSGCTAFVTSTAGLLICRFFLGITEAPFFPCAIYLLSCWYKKRELGIRVALFVSPSILALMIASDDSLKGLWNPN